MDEHAGLAHEFEAHRTRLQGVAYRMLGSLSEAEDAVQEAWLHLSRSDRSGVENLGGWLTTVVSRVCLDALRSRKARREDPVGADVPEATAPREHAVDPEQEALMADSVGLALLVVLEALTPAERVAFVLHDLFAVPFEEIAPIVGRSADAARQLASRARRRVQGAPVVPDTELDRQREIVGAFLAALRSGDVDGLVALLDPNLVVRADGAVTPPSGRDVREWAKGAITGARGARAARLALVDGAVGLVVAPRGKLFRVLRFTIANGTIASVDVVAETSELEKLEVSVLED